MDSSHPDTCKGNGLGSLWSLNGGTFSVTKSTIVVLAPRTAQLPGRPAACRALFDSEPTAVTLGFPIRSTSYVPVDRSLFCWEIGRGYRVDRAREENEGGRMQAFTNRWVENYVAKHNQSSQYARCGGEDKWMCG